MTLHHRIRLRGFWDTTPLEGGRSRHVRRFGRPRALDPGETAWLVGDFGPAVVRLNGEEIGRTDAGPFAFEVTDRLLPRNELAIECASPPEEVALEIRRPSEPQDRSERGASAP